MASTHLIFFQQFRLDLLNQQLWRGEEPIPLRAKTLAVLRYLIEHAGRLVTREELVKTVWPDISGAEQGPKRCILELRAALDDTARSPQFIETVGRRGYRFIASLSTTSPVSSAEFRVLSSPPQPTPSPQSLTPPLVGRETELAQLHYWLEKALSGERQVVFVAGEPGIGKTSLVETFLMEIEGWGLGVGEQGTRGWGLGISPFPPQHLTPNPQSPIPNLWIGRGQCIEHYGEGEAYLPVLEALGQLAKGPERALLLDLLRRYAPSWLMQLPTLVTERELETLQRKLQGVTRQRMLREIAAALTALAAEIPVVLVLEDLHWSDYSTLDFLTALAQHRESARLLLIGTYRPVEMFANGHPLRTVTQELLSHGQAHELPLEGLTRAAVEGYLDTRFPQHAFPDRFANLLQLRTGGNPLFLVNLITDLVDQGLLTQDGHKWALRGALTVVEERVPDSSRHLIEKQIARLTPETQQLLEAASVAGAEFAAAAVAAALDGDEEKIEEQCEVLVRREQFLRRAGTDEWPDGTRTARYGFRHALYQQLWYERVPLQRRQRLHLRIGGRQEKAYGSRAAEFAAELAVHFERGREYQHAIHYLQQAGENAVRRSAQREAVTLLSRGLTLLQSLPDASERVQHELFLQVTLGASLVATKGYAAAEVEAAYIRALALCQQMGETPRLFPVLWGLWAVYAVRAQHRKALELGEQLFDVAQRQQDPAFLIQAHWAVAQPALFLGDFTRAQEHFTQALTLYDPQKHSPAQSPVFRAGQDPGVNALAMGARIPWFLGYPDQALTRVYTALSLAEELRHPLSLGYALGAVGIIHHLRREGPGARERGEAAIALCREHGLLFYQALGLMWQGWGMTEQGEWEEGIALMQEGFATWRALGAEIGLTHYLTSLVEAYAKAGRIAEAKTVLAEAFSLVEKNDERFYEAELYRLKGELTLQKLSVVSNQLSATNPKSLTPNPQLEAEACFLKAIEIARKQQAKSLELRAALSLSRLWQRQRKRQEAHRRLSAIYYWFTEGFETVDLHEAKILLETLRN